MSGQLWMRPPDVADPGLDWRQRAACIGEEPELFFPIGSGRQADEQIALAKHVCSQCPVIRQCRSIALSSGYEGIWGGLDDSERRAIRRNVNATIAHSHTG
jgi:WhiB family redox-sensing transcriptional regulator